MENETYSPRTLRNAVSNLYLIDEDFRTELQANPGEAIGSRFGDIAFEIKLHQEEPNEISVLVPQHSPELETHLKAMVAETDSAPTRGQFDATLVLKAWEDQGFADELVANPAGVIGEEMRQFHGTIPSNSTVKAFAEGANECIITLPAPMAADGELTDGDLDGVAGGDGAVGLLVAGAIVGAIASKVVDVVWSATAPGGQVDTTSRSGSSRGNSRNSKARFI